MLADRLQHFLEDTRAEYDTIPHARAVTAHEIAAAAHVSGRDLAKTVMVKLDGGLAMIVLPSNHRVDLARLQGALDIQNVELAHEAEFKDRFPDCEPGAMPPFGNLYEVEVYVDTRLSAHEQIAFNGGNHTELLRMPYREFERLLEPKYVHLEAAS